MRQVKTCAVNNRASPPLIDQVSAAMDWWRDDQGHALTRDYFRVESREGVRVWLYRQGLFERAFNEHAPPTWFLHGVFA